MASNLDMFLTVANPQASSPHFSLLPAEIRGLMYSFVVHFSVTHIKNRPSWLKGQLYCYKHGEVLCERDFYRSRTCPRRAHPLGLPLSARLDSVLFNNLLPARCSWWMVSVCFEIDSRAWKWEKKSEQMPSQGV